MKPTFPVLICKAFTLIIYGMPNANAVIFKIKIRVKRITRTWDKDEPHLPQSVFKPFLMGNATVLFYHHGDAY